MKKKNRWPVSPLGAALGGWLVLAAFLFGGLFWGKGPRVISRLQTDFSDYYLPMAEYGFSRLRGGIIPLWNPYIFSGQPFAANFEAALFYPPNWLHFFLPPSTAFNLLAVFHVLLAGAGFFLWARRRGLGPGASWVGSAVFMLNGAFLPRLYAGQVSNVFSISWAPFLFWCVERMIQGENSRRLWLTACGCAALQLLAGHPQYVLYTFLAILLYVGLGPQGLSAKARVLLGLGTAYGAAVMLCAVQVLPGLEGLSNSRRGAPLGLETTAYNSLAPPYLLTLGMQFAFGRQMGEPAPWLWVPYWGKDYWENNLYMGMIGCWLALYALFQGPRKGLRAAGWTALAAAALSLGSYLPLYPLLYHLVPFFSQLRGMNKFGFLVVLMLAMLCATGLDLILKKTRTARPVVPGLALAGGFFCLAAAYWAYSAQQGPGGTWDRLFHLISSHSRFLDTIQPESQAAMIRVLGFNFSFCFLLAGIEILVPTLLLRFLGPGKKLAGLLSLYLVVNLVIFAKIHYRDFPLAGQSARIQALRQTTGQTPPDSRILLKLGEWGMPYEKDAWGTNPFAGARYVSFLARTQGVEPEELMNGVTLLDGQSPPLGLLRVDDYLEDQGDSLGSRPVSVPAVPRFQWIDQWKVLRGAEGLEGLFSGGFNPRREILLEDPPDPVPSRGPSGRLSARDLSEDVLEVEAETTHPSILYVGENYFPGWKIRDLSGHPPQDSYPILIGDYFLRAVPLAAGTHHFEMRYEPAAFRLGLWITLVFLAGIMGLAIGEAAFLPRAPGRARLRAKPRAARA